MIITETIRRICVVSLLLAPRLCEAVYGITMYRYQKPFVRKRNGQVKSTKEAFALGDEAQEPIPQPTNDVRLATGKLQRRIVQTDADPLVRAKTSGYYRFTDADAMRDCSGEANFMAWLLPRMESLEDTFPPSMKDLIGRRYSRIEETTRLLVIETKRALMVLLQEETFQGRPIRGPWGFVGDAYRTLLDREDATGTNTTVYHYKEGVGTIYENYATWEDYQTFNQLGGTEEFTNTQQALAELKELASAAESAKLSASSEPSFEMALETSGEGDSQAEQDSATTGSAKPTSWKWRLQASVCILSGTAGLVMIGMYLFGKTSKRVKERRNKKEKRGQPQAKRVSKDTGYESEHSDDHYSEYSEAEEQV